MKLVRIFLLGSLCAGVSMWGQSPGAANDDSKRSVLDRVPDPEAVVGVVDGTPITYSQVQGFLSAMPAAQRAAATKDPEAFLRQYGLMNLLCKQAEQRKLDQESPYREQLAYQRAMLLSTAGLNALSQDVTVSGAEAEAYFEQHKGEYAEYATKVIYLPFSNALPKPGEVRKSMTENDALALAQKLVAELRAGADFVALVKQHSKDEASASKNGDFAKLKTSDNLPDAVKAVVFKLKPGEISEPVRMPNGFYLFRMESVTAPEYLSVAAQINRKLHDEKFRRKMDALRDGVAVKDVRAEWIK